MKTQELLQQVNSRIPEDSGINAFIKNAFLGEEIIVSRNGLSLSIAEGWGIYEILLKQDGKRIHYAEISKRQPDYPETILKYVDWLMPETQETMATGGGVEDRMYNFLKDDLKELEKAIREGNNEEVERFFSYWGYHLKSLKTKTNDRMYNFLKDDLKELEKAIREGNNEEVERFFSYWGYHLKSLKMAQGGSMAKGGGVENSLILIEPTAERNGVEVRKTKNDINSAELRKVSVSGRDNGYIASVTKSGSVIISGSSWRGKMVNSPVDMTIVEEKVKENLPQIIKIIETYSSGGSMATGGGINEDSYTEYSIIGDEIEEHFDDEDSLRDYYNNLTEEEQRSVQMFSKEWNNEDGRWVEGEVIIIKNKDELLKFGGSMARGGGISDELQLSKGDYIVPSKEYEKEGWKPMKIIQVKGDMVSVEYDDGTKGEQFLRSLISRIKYGYLKIKSCYEMARGGNIIWIGDKIRVLKGIYGDYRHPKYANKEFYIIDMRDGKYIDTRSEDGVSETFSIKDEGETFERIIMAKGGRVQQHKSEKKMSWGRFHGPKMAEYAKKYGSPKAGMAQISKEWKKYKEKHGIKEDGGEIERAVLLDSEGIPNSTKRSDYNLPDDHILKGSELVITKICGEQKRIKDPKVSDLPD